MAKTKYHIRLSEEERVFLTKIICEQQESSRAVMRARILLMSDLTQTDKVSIRKLADLLGTTDTTISTVRNKYANEGCEAAVYRKPRVVTGKYDHKPYKPYKRRINDEIVRQIRDLAETQPPEGHKKWSTRLLSKAAAEKRIVGSIAPVTVGKILKATPYRK